jgi:hypothetical protein
VGGILSECCYNGIFDFASVDSDSCVDDDVWISICGTKGKYLSRLVDVPVVVICKHTSSGFGFLASVEFTGLNVDDKFLTQRLGSHINSIMFVR